MNAHDWDFARYQASGQEGDVPVPGAVLRYRLAGPADAQDVVVFENGWSAPFPYAVWIEHALASKVRVLSYDRAGVGDSRSTQAPTTRSMTAQLLALLAHLGLRQPVVIAGHSYGGLLAALHAAQAPERVRAIVQIDPTPELGDDLVDAAMRILPLSGRILQLCALLGIDGPLFLDLDTDLPPEIFARVKRGRGWLARSLGGAIAEIRLLDEVRRLVGTSDAAKRCPRLVVSGTQRQVVTSWLQKLLVDEEKGRRYWRAVEDLHRRQASFNDASRRVALPYTHVRLVTCRAGAEAIASDLLAFIR
ncbi:MAG TPA: alpha/beta hydrolase [Nevskiaceae bacterium]|nr:alpha/beta hydrolase [Nevskiaceae bacterium]